MTLRRRMAVGAFLAGTALAVLALARYRADDIVAHVVENALMQKLPEGADRAAVHFRFRQALGSTGGKEEKLVWLLDLSRFLEKRQVLSSDELERLLSRSGSLLETPSP